MQTIHGQNASHRRSSVHLWLGTTVLESRLERGKLPADLCVSLAQLLVCSERSQVGYEQVRSDEKLGGGEFWIVNEAGSEQEEQAGRCTGCCGRRGISPCGDRGGGPVVGQSHRLCGAELIRLVGRRPAEAAADHPLLHRVEAYLPEAVSVPRPPGTNRFRRSFCTPELPAGLGRRVNMPFEAARPAKETAEKLGLAPHV